VAYPGIQGELEAKVGLERPLEVGQVMEIDGPQQQKHQGDLGGAGLVGGP
jgi:hypothetical protein